MLFNSRVFLFAFLPVAYFVFWKLSSKQLRYMWLTIAGYVFYSFWNYKFCAIMAFSTLVSYTAGIGFLHFQDSLHRKLCLIVPIVVDLSLLSFFKYLGIWNFAFSSGEWLTSLWGMDAASSLLWKFHFHSFLWSRTLLEGALLPVGISFYTFHTISYIVDSYRGTIKPTKNIFEFAGYVALFPQLVAGPIVRFRQVEDDLEHLDTADRRSGLDIGWSYLVIGLIKKVLIADTIAAIINPGLGSFSTLGTAGAWLCALGYTYQIYFDFSIFMPPKARTLTWPSALRICSASAFRKISIRRTRLLIPLISGDDGISHCLLVCGTIYIFRLAAIEVACIATCSSPCCWVGSGMARTGPFWCGAVITAGC